LALHDFYSQSVLTVSLQETTHFSCVARNDLVDSVHEAIKNFTVTVDQPEIRAGKSELPHPFFFMVLRKTREDHYNNQESFG
jgi:hypothetical protein